MIKMSFKANRSVSYRSNHSPGTGKYSRHNKNFKTTFNAVTLFQTKGNVNLGMSKETE